MYPTYIVLDSIWLKSAKINTFLLLCVISECRLFYGMLIDRLKAYATRMCHIVLFDAHGIRGTLLCTKLDRWSLGYVVTPVCMRLFKFWIINGNCVMTCFSEQSDLLWNHSTRLVDSIRNRPRTSLLVRFVIPATPCAHDQIMEDVYGGVKNEICKMDMWSLDLKTIISAIIRSQDRSHFNKISQNGHVVRACRIQLILKHTNES